MLSRALVKQLKNLLFEMGIFAYPSKVDIDISVRGAQPYIESNVVEHQSFVMLLLLAAAQINRPNSSHKFRLLLNSAGASASAAAANTQNSIANCECWERTAESDTIF